MTAAAPHPSIARLLDAAAAHARTVRGIETVNPRTIQADLSISAQTWHNWLKRGVSKDGAIAAENAYECSASWILTGTDHGPTTRFSTLDLIPEVREAFPLSYSVRHHQPTLGLPTITLGSLEMSDPPQPLFVAALADDALAPNFPCGTQVVWSTTRNPRPGLLVLVRDRHGQVHARQYRQGREPGRFTAAALHEAFTSLDSAADDLRVLAVYKGLLDPED